MKQRVSALTRLFAALASIAALAWAPSANAYLLGSPGWEIELTDAGYSDYLGDLTPSFLGREYLSGEWGAAVSYKNGDSGAKTTWLEPKFSYPDWQTNSDFKVSQPMQLIGYNADSLPIVGSVIANNEVSISQRFEMIDTRIGTPMGTSPASAGGAGGFLMSNRYVLMQSYSITNTTSDPLGAVQFFQMLHGLNAQAGVYDNRAYAGPMSAFRYDATLWGRDDTASTGQFDYIGFHASVAPSAIELGHYGVEGNGIDNHVTGKPSVGTHLSIEANTLNGNDSFAPEVRWVAGAQRWDLGAMASGETRTIDVLLTIRTGWEVVPNSEGGASGTSNGLPGDPGSVDYSFDDVSSPGHLYVNYEPEDWHGIQELVALGQFGAPTFAIPGDTLQLFDVEYEGTFSGGVTLTFTYDPTLLPGGFDAHNLRVFHWNGSQWEDLGGTVDTTNHTISAFTSSLSPFAVGAVPEPQTWLMLVAGCVATLLRIARSRPS